MTGRRTFKKSPNRNNRQIRANRCLPEEAGFEVVSRSRSAELFARLSILQLGLLLTITVSLALQATAGVTIELELIQRVKYNSFAI